MAGLSTAEQTDLVNLTCWRAMRGEFDDRISFSYRPLEVAIFAATLGEKDGFACIVMTELWDNPGESITTYVDAAARRAHALLSPHLPIEEIVFVEHYGPISYTSGNTAHTFDHVSIDRHGMRVGGWKTLIKVPLEGSDRVNPKVG